jgi:hypothetical protein
VAELLGGITQQEASEIIADLKSEDEGVRAARIEMIVEQHPVVQHYKKKARR